MFRVRYYDQMIHPDHFKKKGLSGRVIVVLNWFRWKLETYIQKRVLKWLAKGNSLPKSRVSELLQQFNLGVKAEKVQKEATSPLLNSTEPTEVPRVRSDRYVGPKLDQALVEQVEDETGLPMRPKPLDNLIGQYAFNERAKRYARGKMFNVGDEDNFENVEVPDGK